MMATRDEYVSGKRRPAKPAASKGAAASEGKPASGRGEKKGAEAASKPKPIKAVAIKEEGGRRAADSSSKVPALPPGMGMARSRGEPAQAPGERRRDGRPADGPPPGAAGCMAVGAHGAWGPPALLHLRPGSWAVGRLTH